MTRCRKDLLHIDNRVWNLLDKGCHAAADRVMPTDSVPPAEAVQGVVSESVKLVRTQTSVSLVPVQAGRRSRRHRLSKT